MTSIEVVAADAFEVQADALVNPANRQPDFSWGSHVTEGIRRRAGAVVRDERRAFGTIELGEAVTTSGGELPFRYLIHAAVLDKYDFNPLFLLRLRQRTSDDTLRRATRNALVEARRLGVDSVAFTPMGAGIGGMPMAKCARIMIDEVRRHLEDADQESPRRIVFAVKIGKNRAVFETVVRSLR